MPRSQPPNHGNTPGLSPEYWGLLTAQGASGAQGTTGLAGPAGPQGVPGSAGPPGEKGDRAWKGPRDRPEPRVFREQREQPGCRGRWAVRSRGADWAQLSGYYNSTANYGLGDGVLWQGAGWVSLVAGNHGNTPDQSPAAWAMFAAAGSPGRRVRQEL